MQLDRLLHVSLDLFQGLACGDTSRNIRHIGAIVIASLLYDNKEPGHIFLPFSENYTMPSRSGKIPCKNGFTSVSPVSRSQIGPRSGSIASSKRKKGQQSRS